jgi:hypothetical protein
LYVYTTICLSVHLLMNIWFVSTFLLLWIVLLWTCYVYLITHFQVFLRVWGGIYLWVELLSCIYGKFVFSYFRNYQIIFYSNRIILLSYQQCTNGPVLPYPHQHFSLFENNCPNWSKVVYHCVFYFDVENLFWVFVGN